MLTNSKISRGGDGQGLLLASKGRMPPGSPQGPKHGAARVRGTAARAFARRPGAAAPLTLRLPASGLTYEEERKLRIASNQQLIKSLGLDDAADAAQGSASSQGASSSEQRHPKHRLEGGKGATSVVVALQSPLSRGPVEVTSFEDMQRLKETAGECARATRNRR